MTKKIFELRTGDTFAGEGVGDDFSCAEFPRIVLVLMRRTKVPTSPTLDRIGVKRASGFISLRAAIEARAREEAFA